MHSVIDRKKKNPDIFTPAQFVQIIEEARVKQPYKVHYLSHDFFKDYSSLQLYRSIFGLEQKLEIQLSAISAA